MFINKCVCFIPQDPDMFWDFITLRPETTHQVSFLFSDRGTPDGYRRMNGYGSHTFKLVNKEGKPVYCKFHWKVKYKICAVFQSYFTGWLFSYPNLSMLSVFVCSVTKASRIWCQMKPPSWPRMTQTTPSETCITTSLRETSPPGVSKSRSWPLRRQRNSDTIHLTLPRYSVLCYLFIYIHIFCQQNIDI